jgi:hypothetical protein
MGVTSESWRPCRRSPAVPTNPLQIVRQMATIGPKHGLPVRVRAAPGA